MSKREERKSELWERWKSNKKKSDSIFPDVGQPHTNHEWDRPVDTRDVTLSTGSLKEKFHD